MKHVGDRRGQIQAGRFQFEFKDGKIINATCNNAPVLALLTVNSGDFPIGVQLKYSSPAFPKYQIDLDLWTRLVELGQHRVVQEVLYETVLAPGTISSDKRTQQEATTQVIAECIRSRMAIGDDSAQLEQVARITGNRTRFNRRKTDADFYYFVASCLRGKNPGRSRHYLIEALKRNPFHFKALIRAIQAQIDAH